MILARRRREARIREQATAVARQLAVALSSGTAVGPTPYSVGLVLEPERAGMGAGACPLLGRRAQPSRVTRRAHAVRPTGSSPTSGSPGGSMRRRCAGTRGRAAWAARSTSRQGVSSSASTSPACPGRCSGVVPESPRWRSPRSSSCTARTLRSTIPDSRFSARPRARRTWPAERSCTPAPPASCPAARTRSASSGPKRRTSCRGAPPGCGNRACLIASAMRCRSSSGSSRVSGCWLRRRAGTVS